MTTQEKIRTRAMAIWAAWYRDRTNDPRIGFMPGTVEMQTAMTHAYDLAEAEYLDARDFSRVYDELEHQASLSAGSL